MTHSPIYRQTSYLYSLSSIERIIIYISLNLDEYGHYDEYMMSTYDAPNFMPLENSNSKIKSVPRDEFIIADKPKPAKVSYQPRDVTTNELQAGEQLFTIILPNSYYNSETSNHSADGVSDRPSNSASGSPDPTIDYDAELPAPMKSPTVFDYHEVSLDDYDWDRIFGEAAAAGPQ